MSDIYMEQPSKVLVNTMQFSEYTLYITGPITSPDEYMEHFAALKVAQEGDVVTIHLSTPGGDLSTATMLIDHIRDCPARVVGVVGMECASAGSALMVAMDEIRVSELSTALIHSFSYSVGGNAGSVHNHADFNNRLNERWIRATYGDFLPETKILRVLDGIDILLDADQIAEYWNNMQRIRLGSEHCECDSEENGIGVYAPYDEGEGNEAPLDLLPCIVTNWEEYDDSDDDQIWLSVLVSSSVYNQIEGKKIKILVDTEGKDGA